MVNVNVRIHDKFSIEFKTGFLLDKENPTSDFIMNTWIFLPYSLDINTETYPKDHFYRDMKSYLRLITPHYTLEELSSSDSYPYLFLQVAFSELADEPSDKSMAEFEYQIKMFMTIVKSALRKEVINLFLMKGEEARFEAVTLYVKRIEKITNLFRTLKPIIDKPGLPEKSLTYFSFGDEFISNRIEQKSFEILKKMKRRYPAEYIRLKKPLMLLVNQERKYRETMGYELTTTDNPKKNSELLHRFRLLRKYIENHLFLDAKRKKDGRLAEQVSLSIAAGIAMVFATAVAFSAQQMYGNFTMPLFVALVVSYMLKDRIKEIARYYFVNNLSKKYFDNKTDISIKGAPIGWIKEGMDFVPEMKVPKEVIQTRDRSDILESDNRNTAEKIILYRKLVHIDRKTLDNNIQYDISGINDIARFNLSNFILKMDDPVLELFVPTKNEEYETVDTKFIYYINFIIQLKYKDCDRYKRFRLIISRDGIEEIERF